MPPGRWHFRPELAAASAQSEDEGEELARLLSHPYLPTGATAQQPSGVILHDPERAQPGVNFYVSGHAPEAVLMTMEGKVLQRWRCRFEQAFPDREPTSETTFWRRAHLLANGDLLAIFQGGGLIRLDLESRLIWRSASGFYNDLLVGADGTIYAVVKAAKRLPEVRTGEPVLEDSIAILDADGHLVEQFSLLRSFQISEHAQLLRPLPAGADIFHTNTLEMLEGSLPAPWPELPAGGLLVSLRAVDIVAIVDLHRRQVVRAWRGPWKAQHQPTPLPGGRILLFDNLGADGHSRVLEFDPQSGQIVWEYRGEEGRPLFSPQAGSCQRLANGNTLITESERGRAVEISPDLEIVWEFLTPHRGGPRGELVATLWEVLRIDPLQLAFLQTIETQQR